MLYKKIGLENCAEDAFIEAFVAEKVGDFVRNAILVIPGGGYGNVCANREGEPIAHAFMAQGFNAFVLHYSVGEDKRFPTQLIEASAAVKHIKDHAQDYNIDPEKVFVVGFSAGGHLAACLGTMWERQEIYDVLDMPFGYNKPKGMMLIYPVISERFHARSFVNLLGEDASAEQRRACSIENCISEKSSPAFILHTANDQTVYVGNALTLANALAEQGIRFEMHIYPDAPHGVALGNEITKCNVEKWCNPAIAKWVENAAYWADQLK